MLTGQILLQLIIILVVVQLCGFLCQRIGQQWVVGEILAGLVLGPSLLGMVLPGLKIAVFPSNTLPTLQTLGDIGLILYMFSLGARLDTHAMLAQSHKAIVVSLSGIVFPLLLGGALAFFLYPSFAGNHATQFSFLLMVGTAMAITAFPVLARLLVEKQMIGMRVGMLALTCAAVDDVLAWCLLALVIAIIHASDLLTVLMTVCVVILFTLIMFTLVRPFLIWVERHMPAQRLLIMITMLLLLLSAYFTNAIGIHPVFGAFIMGLILPRKANFVAQIRSIDLMNSILFLPLFFVYSGLRTQVGLIHSPLLGLLCLLIFFVACIGKFTGGAFAAHLMGERWKEALTVGVLMNTRGLVELIVLNIGLDLGVLSPLLFTMLVIMALITTMMASPLLFFLGYRQGKSSFLNDGVLEEHAPIYP